MSNTGVFGLSGYNDKNLEGLIADKTREAFREYGYFGGTFGASRLDRIDYSNDTSTGIFRKTIRAYAGATGNSNFGYFGGGYGGVSAVDRIDYSNDTAVEGLRGRLSLARWRFSATGNSNVGYFGGGARSNVSNIVSTVDRIDYSNDLAIASIRGPLSLPKGFTGSSGNSNFGYYYGGANPDIPASYTNIERINYSNDTTKLSVRGLLVSGGGSTTGNNNFAYILRGGYTRIQRFDYSNDLSTTVNRAITNAFTNRGATGNSNFGYFGGGYNSFSTVDRLDYSNDNTQTALRGPLSYGRTTMSATSSHSFGGSPISQYGVFAKPFGYFGGGNPGSTSIVDRIDYSNDTQNTIVKTTLTSSNDRSAATGNSNFGYFGGGATTSQVARIDYSNDNQISLTRGPLSSARFSLASTGNSNFGYFSGGFDPAVPGRISKIDRINYSNDISTALVKGSLSVNRTDHASTGTQNFGYFSGGTPGPLSSIDRLNYSNDTSNASNRNLLLNITLALAATGNSNFGYFGGGTHPASRSIVERLDYSNDTSTLSTRGPLSAARSSLSATGNSNFGYFGGGLTPSPAVFSTVDRIDYANDTATASVRGSLTLARFGLAATSPTAFGGALDFTPTQQFFDIQSMRRIEDTTSASVKKRVLGSYGYFGGGAPGPVSTVDRIDYSNDTATASVRGPLSVARFLLSATGNSNFGYFGGGYLPGPNISLIDRIDYSNDSASASVRGPLTQARIRPSATGNSNFGYFVGGNRSSIERINYTNDLLQATIRSTFNVGNRRESAATGNNNFGYVGGGDAQPAAPAAALSSIERINYSNDISSTLIRGPLSLARIILRATGNSNFGYFGGGSGPVSTVDRVDYSNDTATTSVRGPLSLARGALAASGNSNFGYFGGGQLNPGIIYSTLDRVDYSNDTIAASVRGPLSSARRYAVGTTNAANS
jgi:hypothetical protein